MTEGQRKTLHELLDRMIDDGLGYGVCEYVVLPDDISTVITPDRHSPHPAPFPIELPTNIIKCCSKEGDIVYDPFMGSGTVALAAKNLGRHYIGSELNPDYIIMANERLGLV